MQNRFNNKSKGRRQQHDSNSVVHQSTASWAHTDASELMRTTTEVDSTRTAANHHHHHLRNADGSYSRECYLDIARAMQQCLEIKDRKYHLKTYEECFVGREAIDFLLDYLQLASREEAVLVGKQMNSTIRCLEHVVNDHKDQLKDEYLFYRFTDVLAAKKEFTLEEVLRAFQLGVRVEDRTYHLRTYPNVFVGSEAIDFLLKYKFAFSRERALELGRQLEEEFDLFVHVTGEHKLKDDYIFYRMLVPKAVRKSKRKNTQQLQKQALKQWIAVFTIVAMVLYYYLF